MAIDDNAIEALRRQFELEDVSALPLAGAILTALQTVSHPLPFPFDKLVDRLKDGMGADATHRIRVMVEVCGDEIVSQDKRLRGLEAQLDEEQVKQRTEAASELLLDASRRASVTRSLERVKRIGMILANGILPQVVDGGFEHVEGPSEEGLAFRKPVDALRDVQELTLDAGKWHTVDDLYDSFFEAVGAPPWHGRNFDALHDSIVTGDINRVEVPYRIRIQNFARTGTEARQVTNRFVALIQRFEREGCPVSVRIEE